MTKLLIAVTAALALTLAFASIATGQSSLDGYNDVGGDVQDQVDDGAPENGVAGTQESGGEPGDEEADDAAANVVASDDDSLPFTGLDVAFLVGIGGMLLLLGIGMRRLTRPSTTA